MVEWYKRYIEAGDEFIPTNLVVKVAENGQLESAGHLDEETEDHHFGGKHVGKHIEWREPGLGSVHSPVYLEVDTGRFYYIRSREKA